VTRHQHIPVLLDRVGELLAPSFAPNRTGHGDPVFVDGTLGLGGHAEALLARFDDLVLIGVDRDPEAISRATERLAPFGHRAIVVNAVYDQIPAVAGQVD
jgi:16S rRNA (cytosine1402-N4)-methyltransferase